jgi:Spy/CpxP family protein refolding chaperone
MKKVHYAALAVALAAVPAVAQAQQAQEQHREHAEAWMQQRGPGMSASALAGLRAELNLSDAQVAELEGIAARLQALNEPLLAQLREHAQERVGEVRQRREAMTAEQREQMREQMRERMGRAGTAAGTGTAVGHRVPEELRPVMQQLRENHQSALQQAAAVLTPEQQAQARALMAERREGWRERASERREQRLERRERRDQGERPAAGPRGPRARALNR